jgi:hypothetical protein
LWSELEEFLEVVYKWIWQVPISVGALILAKFFGYEVPWMMVYVMIGGFILTYVAKRLRRATFYDIPKLVEKFQVGSESQVLNAGFRLLNYVNDPVQGYEHKFIAVRNYIGSALKLHIVSRNDEIALLSLSIATSCAQHPQNIYPLAREEVTSRCLFLLSHRNPKIIVAACECLCVFAEDKSCQKELCEDKATRKSLTKLLGHFDFAVCEKACVLLCVLMSVATIETKLEIVADKDTKAMSKLSLLLDQEQESVLLTSICSLLAILAKPSSDTSDSEGYTSTLIDQVLDNKIVPKVCSIISSGERLPELSRSACVCLGHIIQHSDAGKRVAKQCDVMPGLKALAKGGDSSVAHSAKHTLHMLSD